MRNLYTYDNYREFLKDRLDDLAKSEGALTQRALAKKIGFKSGGAVANVLVGKRNLSEEAVEKFSQYLKLKKEEKEFLQCLVNLNQSTDIEDKRYYADAIFRCRGFSRFHPLAESQYRYYTHWYYVAIRELVALPDFKEDGRWISEFFGGLFSAEEAKKAVEALVTLQLLIRGKGGRLEQASGYVRTESEIPAAFTAQLIVPYYNQMISLGAESMTRFPKELREVSSVTLPLSTDDLPALKGFLQKLHQEFITMSETAGKPANSVFQFQILLFPLGMKK